MERWWDGTTWTEYTRTAPVPVGQPAYPYPTADVIASPGGGGRRPGAVVVAIVVALVIIGGVVAGIMVLGKGSSDNDADGGPTPSATHTRPPGTDAPDDPSDPGTRGRTSGAAVDGNDGISLPVLSGWKGNDSSPTSAASLVTGEYQCPGDHTKSCVRGGVFAQPAESLKLTSTDPQEAAEQDIAGNAKDSYGADIYGPTTSHRELASQAVTVAGQKGYMVRWKVVTKSGTDGYVESLAFPSPSGGGRLVLVRFGFDVGGQAPGLDTMDRITQGIKADSSGSGGTGV